MTKKKMTLAQKMMAPTPPKWKKWSIILKSVATLSAIVAVAIPVTAPIAGSISGAAGLASLYCSSRVDNGAVEALSVVVEQAAKDFPKK